MRVLVVEDEEKLSTAISEGLTAEGYEVTVAHNGEAGLHLLLSRDFDIVLLDVMLPKRSGLDVLRDVRRHGLEIPVLVLTSRDSIRDRVFGLDAGADDYLVKPFAFAELLARTRALLRRGNKAETEVHHRLTLADLELDLRGRSATRSGCKLDLTSKEFSLLEYLLVHSGRVVSREMLAREVWKEAFHLSALNNVIDVQVARLRRKVDDPFPRKLLHTVRGVGFVLREEQD
jgi:DNA-binding response OmpR family regulator